MEPAQIAEKIFSVEPKEPKTIRLGLEEADHEYVFELMLNILLEGIFVKYGEGFKPEYLTVEVLSTLNEYMKSMGFIVNKHFDKGGHAYCNFNIENPRIFSIDKHQLRKNQIIERNKLTDYYIDLGEFQLNFDYFC